MAAPILARGATTRNFGTSSSGQGARRRLVLFRDERASIGLLGLHCPHRGASLEYGDIEDRRDFVVRTRLAVRGRRALFGHADRSERSSKLYPERCAICLIRFGNRAVSVRLSWTLRQPIRRPCPILALARSCRPAILRSDPFLRLQLVELHRERRRPGAFFDSASRRIRTMARGAAHFSISERHPAVRRRRDCPTMKVDLTQAGTDRAIPNTSTRKSFALPTILQIGNAEFTRFKATREALTAGSHNAQLMFVTPNDDQGAYTVPGESLQPLRITSLSRNWRRAAGSKSRPRSGRLRPAQVLAATRQRPHEDIACQSTQKSFWANGASN